MANTNSITVNVQSQIKDWLQQEQDGNQFPVPFDEAWKIAGYSEKGKGKRKLTGKTSHLIEGEDYIIKKGVFAKSGKSGLSGRSSDSIYLTCDAFKQFCLMAKTEEGHQIRQYFIEAEKNWKLVQQQTPEFAQEVQMQKLRNEALQLEAQKAQAEAQKTQAELSLTQFRHTVTHTCPEPVQQKVLGYQVVEKTEYRDRVFREEQLLRDGETITKTELCYRYGILTKNGKPDWKRLNQFLSCLPDEAWDEQHSILTNKEVKRDYLDKLDALFSEADQRNLFLGE